MIIQDIWAGIGPSIWSPAVDALKGPRLHVIVVDINSVASYSAWLPVEDGDVTAENQEVGAVFQE